MHEVDFCGVIITFNSMLRGCVEVELKRLELAMFIVSVQKVQRTTIWTDINLPRIVKRRQFTIFVDLLRPLELF